MRTHVMEDFKSIGNGKTEVLRSSAIRFIENITAECILHRIAFYQSLHINRGIHLLGQHYLLTASGMG